MKEQILEIADKLRNGEVDSNKAQNLLLGLFGVIKSLPTDEEIEKEAMKHDAEYMSETFFEKGAKWMREIIKGNVL